MISQSMGERGSSTGGMEMPEINNVEDLQKVFEKMGGDAGDLK